MGRYDARRLSWRRGPVGQRANLASSSGRTMMRPAESVLSGARLRFSLPPANMALILKNGWSWISVRVRLEAATGRSGHLGDG
ncbi:MAG: hypothetical protein M0C28_00660 [Candidatus Moduliflexus flocculans]|nr:hypothetical protein [Candidatus Moduliflexus flocculans]